MISGSGTRALCLFSGGLDSQLTVAVLRDQDIYVEAVTFTSPFFDSIAPRRAASSLRLALHVEDFTADIIGLLDNPPHGFGACMNPCVDCHALMIRRAGQLMEKLGFDLIATGEVLGQRPKSQNRRALGLVGRSSGYSDRLLRPLSARLLEPTLPETNGLVDRSRMLSLAGRGRNAQMQLARHYGIREYPSPAGGCRLTEPNYCRRLQDMMCHEGLGDGDALGLLLYGRHLRLPGGEKVIVGRNQADNDRLIRVRGPEDTLIEPFDRPGPTILLPGKVSNSEGIEETAMRIAESYMKPPAEGALVFVLRRSSGDEYRRMAYRPLERRMISQWLL